MVGAGRDRQRDPGAPEHPAKAAAAAVVPGHTQDRAPRFPGPRMRPRAEETDAGRLPGKEGTGDKARSRGRREPQEGKDGCIPFGMGQHLVGLFPMACVRLQPEPSDEEAGPLSPPVGTKRLSDHQEAAAPAPPAKRAALVSPASAKKRQQRPDMAAAAARPGQRTLASFFQTNLPPPST